MGDALSLYSVANAAVERVEAEQQLGLHSPEVLDLARQCHSKLYESYGEGIADIAEARSWLTELEVARREFFLELARMGKLDPDSSVTISGIPIRKWLSENEEQIRRK